MLDTPTVEIYGEHQIRIDGVGVTYITPNGDEIPVDSECEAHELISDWCDREFESGDYLD